MKTVEEKAKAYDEALKVLHKYDGANIMFSQSLKEEMFPELRESEDERIRKAIKSVVSYNVGNNKIYGVSKEEMLAYLEKQREQKFEQKFFINDKVVHKATGKIWTIHHYLKDTNSYYVEDNDGLLHHYIESELKLVEQNPAWSEEDNIMVHDIDYALRCQITYPKSRLDSMLSWIYNLKDRVQPQTKQEWSEEDKAILEKCVGAVKSSCYSHSFKLEAENWLKSLRPQNRWKPSDEQIRVLSDLIIYKERWGSSHSLNTLRELLEQLKKL